MSKAKFRGFQAKVPVQPKPKEKNWKLLSITNFCKMV